jgi:hypothetical protein
MAGRIFVVETGVRGDGHPSLASLEARAGTRRAWDEDSPRWVRIVH